MVENKNANCRGSCNRKLAKKTSTVEECMNLCKKNEMCRHYIWHKLGNYWEQDCLLMLVKKEEVVDVYRNKDNNAISGTCSL